MRVFIYIYAAMIIAPGLVIGIVTLSISLSDSGPSAAGPITEPEQSLAMESVDEPAVPSQPVPAAKDQLPDDLPSADDYRSRRIRHGAWLYQQRCVACHGEQGAGLVGPNLTDRYHLYDFSKRDLLETIRGGVPERGMPKWEGVLSRSDIYDLTRYVWTLRHRELPGRAPEGEFVPADEETASAQQRDAGGNGS